jgi:hypothetical protein
VGVGSGGVASSRNSGGAEEPSPGDIPAGGGLNPGAGNDWRRFWAGGSVTRREGKFKESNSQPSIFDRVGEDYGSYYHIFAPLTDFAASV